ncbi:lipopolysaccharide biosynthesis protein [Prosthecochloris sp. CIB 2401]|uniref:lipopolysaccharide biosynthesis protein n=1 Tax=Prosthecochloris sp. CIB 2401 TaxID=1868325 RepID=UPI00080AB3A6|nr:lipopolysaccharide biosynthesis protein [Prosthecochloris sp. CIB 2401]ANT64593.1 Teichuronic acid biosynthesis protein TuaB [Prosthecochloris sp. CIB 2401]
MSLKQKTVNGLAWSFLDNFVVQGVSFVTGIILARLLSPHEFGLVGMVAIFMALGQSFADSGFTQALIRKKECTQADYSTVFFFNVLVGVTWYLLLLVSAGSIADFFSQPELASLVPVLGLGVVVNSFSIIQTTQLTKRIDFKLQTRVSAVSSILAGIVAVVLAFQGFGVWSLVILALAKNTLTTLFLWFWNEWTPSLVFDLASFKELFGFGSKLLFVGLIDTTYRNIYLMVIGKFFSAADLGFYTRADQFKQLPSQNLTTVVQRVSYPVLSSIQEDLISLKAAYKKLIKSTMLISFVLMIGLAAVAEPLVVTLIGEQWLVSAEYLQLLCFGGMLYPLHALNLNMLNVQGRSDLFLRLEIIKKTLAVPVIIVGINFGIKVMIMAMIVNSLIAYYLNSYWSGRFIGYSMLEQIKDIFPSFLLASAVGFAVWFTGFLFETAPLVTLVIQILTGAVLTISLSELIRLDSYLYMKQTILEKIRR